MRDYQSVDKIQVTSAVGKTRSVNALRRSARSIAASQKRLTRHTRHNEQRLAALADLASRHDLTLDEKIERLLAVGTEGCKMEFGFVARIADGTLHVERCTLTDPEAMKSGFSCPSRDSFCDVTLNQSLPLVIPSASASERWRAYPAHNVLGLETYMGQTIEFAGRKWGTLCFASRAPRPKYAPITDTDAQFLRLMAQWLAGEMERAEMVGAVRQSQQLFTSATDAMHEGFVVEDEHGTVLVCNERGAALLHTRVSDIVGHKADPTGAVFLREDGSPFPRELHPSRLAFTTGQPQREVVMGIMRADHSLLWVNLTAVPLFHPDAKRPHAVVVTFSDITARKQAEEAVQTAQHFAQSVAEHSTSMIYVLDLDTRAFVYSNHDAAAFVGYTAAEAIQQGPDFLLSLIHPDDRARAEAHLGKFAHADDGDVVEYEQRIRHADGDWRWVWYREVVFKRHPDGTPSQILGTAQDVSERKRAEARLRASADALAASEGEMRALFAAMTDAVMVLDGDGRYLSIAPTSPDLLFKPPAELIGKTVYDVFSRKQADQFVACLREARTSGQPTQMEYSLQLGGEKIWFAGTASPMTEGKVLWVARDITAHKRAEQSVKDYAVVLEFSMAELEKANGRLQALATTDGLTELSNHRAFQERLQSEWQQKSGPLALLLLDVDHFKGFNDTWGHPEGDTVLRQVARLIEQNVRKGDMAARYGGEEFAVILPHTDNDRAMAIATRLCTAISSASWDKRPVTVSIGVAVSTSVHADIASLIADADTALYQSKRQGRNRVTLSESADSACNIVASADNAAPRFLSPFHRSAPDKSEAR